MTLKALPDIEVIKITSTFQVGKSDDGAILISRSRDATDPHDFWIEFGSVRIALDFIHNAIRALEDYLATPDVVL